MGSEGGEELGQYIGIEETGQIQLSTIICSTVCPELYKHACMHGMLICMVWYVYMICC